MSITIVEIKSCQRIHLLRCTMISGFMAEHFKKFKDMILPKLSTLLESIGKKKEKPI